MRIKTPEAGRRQTPENQSKDRRGIGSPTHLCGFWWVFTTSQKVQGDQKKKTYKDMFAASKVVETYIHRLRWGESLQTLFCDAGGRSEDQSGLPVAAWQPLPVAGAELARLEEGLPVFFLVPVSVSITMSTPADLLEAVRFIFVPALWPVHRNDPRCL